MPFLSVLSLIQNYFSRFHQPTYNLDILNSNFVLQSIQVTQGLNVGSHQSNVTVHQSDVHNSNQNGDIQSILQRAMRPDQNGNQNGNGGYTINSGGRQNQSLHLPIGSGSTVVSQSLQIPMNDHA